MSDSLCLGQPSVRAMSTRLGECPTPEAPSLDDQRPERVARQQEAAPDELIVALEAAVLVLDREPAVVADGVERGDEARPVDLAEPWEPRHLPAHTRGEGAVA